MGGACDSVLAELHLSIVLFTIFAVCWVIQTIAGWVEFSAQETQHGARPEIFGAEGYVWTWLQATMENWTDGDERLERKVDEIRRQVEALQKR